VSLDCLGVTSWTKEVETGYRINRRIIPAEGRVSVSPPGSAAFHGGVTVSANLMIHEPQMPTNDFSCCCAAMEGYRKTCTPKTQ
jgi:hypothetical protein